jgi:hypothetical protein
MPQKWLYNYICIHLYYNKIYNHAAYTFINIVSTLFNTSFILHYTTLIFQLFYPSDPMVLILSIVLLHSQRQVPIHVCIYLYKTLLK